jgi:VWFA-related protein
MFNPTKVVATSLLLASALLAGAQQLPAPTPGANGIPSLQVTTRLTIEDVTVTDGQGRPVHGLKPSDFVIKEDGKPQEIRSFQELGTGLPTAPSPPSPVLPADVYSNVQTLQSSTSAVNILLLDALNTSPELQGIVRLQALKYLQTMPAGTQIAVLELGSGLRIVRGFTDDREALTAAIQSFRPESILSAPVHTQLEIGDLLNIRAEATINALDAIAGFVTALPGRKNLIWFSKGLSQVTAFGVYQLKYANLNDYTLELNKAYGRLAEAQVAIDPVDPRGVIVGDPRGKTDDVWLDHNSMGEIAAATGGTAYLNRNDLNGAIADAIAGGSNYYSLSYVPPPSKYDGKYHKIDIQVDRPGLQLRYRDGYIAMDISKPFAKKPSANAPANSAALRMAVDHSILPSTGVIFEVRVAPSGSPIRAGDPPAGLLNPKLNGKPLVRYEIVYAVPSSQLTLTAAPDGTRTGEVEVDTVAYGDDGMKLNVEREMVNLHMKPEQVPQFVAQPLYVRVRLDLPPGSLTLHTGVLDVPSQRVGSLEIPQIVPSQ